MTGTSPDPAAVHTRQRRLDPLLERLRAPVDGASLAAFRIIFGLVALIEVFRYFSHGWIGRYWVEPEFHFTYVGFGWVRPLPDPGMHLLWTALGCAAVGITLGAYYRTSCTVFALGFGYSFLLDSARYLNHFYLIAMIAVLLALVPANRVWSVDNWSRRSPQHGPIPAWSLWLLQFQIGVVYVFGALAKLEPDWLRGEPMTTWLHRESDRPLIGPLLGQDWLGPVAAWAGLGFDLLIVFAVAWRRTRNLALVAAAMFHVSNNELFDIGVFPYLAFASLLLFCDPAWPRSAGRWLRNGPWKPPPLRGTLPPLTGFQRTWVAPIALALAAVFVVVQLTVPLRHVFFPGRSNWTEAGHTFSWHMKLRIKNGEARFNVVDPETGDRVIVDPRYELASWQYSKMAIRPEMLRQYAHHLAGRAAENGQPGLKVYAQTSASLNQRPNQALVDPSVDLAAEPASIGTPSWVERLRHPLP
ncbi:MAG: HTTM domain-containing protein [Aeromicrobium sp.]